MTPEERKQATLAWLDELDALYGPPSPELVAEMEAWFDESFDTTTPIGYTDFMTYQTTIDDQIDSIYDTIDALAAHPAVSTVEFRSILASIVERCTDSIDRIDGDRFQR